MDFPELHNALLEDLAIIRIIEPASKIRSLILLKRYFGKTYGHDRLYDGLKELTTQKERIEQIALSFAKQRLYFDCSLVFYDVTTLYFETFKSDEDITDEKRRVIAKGFRKKGFSKDNKPKQKISITRKRLIADHCFVPIHTKEQQKISWIGKTRLKNN